jgi:methyl-accepting chemotaxis protein
MDYGEMILVHSRWKTRLNDAIKGGKPIDVQAAGRDDQCELGQWIHGDGKRYAGNKAYEDLRLKHKRFYASIPPIAAQAGSEPSRALELVNSPTGDFTRSSIEVVNAIAAIRAVLPKQ